MVLGLLARSEVSNLRFSIPTLSIEPASYARVATEIRGDHITVQFDGSRGQNVAHYRHKPRNILFLGFRSLGGSTDREALIIHECTHASMDIAGRAVLLSYSEAAAFTAQCLYYYHRNAAQIDGGANPTFPSAVLREAWNVASIIRGGRSSLNDSDLRGLMTALANDGRYRADIAAGTSVDYDGV